MGLQYVVAKRIFGFDKDKNVKYVARVLIRRLAFRPVTLSVNVFCFFRGKLLVKCWAI